MNLDIINFTTRLLRKCLPVKVQYFEKYEFNNISFDEDLNFSSMKNYPMNYSEITRVNDSLRNIKNLL